MVRWVTNAEISNDLKGRGYAVKTHNNRRDLTALLPIHQQLEINDNSKAEEGPKSGLAYGYRYKTSERWQDVLRNGEDDDPEDQACVICSL